MNLRCRRDMETMRHPSWWARNGAAQQPRANFLACLFKVAGTLALHSQSVAEPQSTARHGSKHLMDQEPHRIMLRLEGTSDPGNSLFAMCRLAAWIFNSRLLSSSCGTEVVLRCHLQRTGARLQYTVRFELDGPMLDLQPWPGCRELRTLHSMRNRTCLLCLQLVSEVSSG